MIIHILYSNYILNILARSSELSLKKSSNHYVQAIHYSYIFKNTNHSLDLPPNHFPPKQEPLNFHHTTSHTSLTIVLSNLITK